MAKKSWQEKMDTARKPEVKEAPMDFAGIRRGQKMLLTTPRLVESFVLACEQELGDGASGDPPSGIVHDEDRADHHAG